MTDFTLTPAEREHVGQHLIAPTYSKKGPAQMTVDLLLRLGYSAELAEGQFGDEINWFARCEELGASSGDNSD